MGGSRLKTTLYASVIVLSPLTGGRYRSLTRADRRSPKGLCGTSNESPAQPLTPLGGSGQNLVACAVPGPIPPLDERHHWLGSWALRGAVQLRNVVADPAGRFPVPMTRH